MTVSTGSPAKPFVEGAETTLAGAEGVATGVTTEEPLPAAVVAAEEVESG